MDPRKNKPIHFRCPKCGADFEFNGGQIAREKEELGQAIHVLNAKMQAHKQEHGTKDPYYAKLKRQKAELEARSAVVKSQYKLAAEQGEVQKLQIFVDLVKSELGKDKTVKLLKEAEDSMCYRNYDMAKQKYNTFNNL